MENKIKYHAIEPNYQNRWILSLPDELDIPEFTINKVSPLKYSNIKGWKKITITILDLIGFDISKKLINNPIKLPIQLKLNKLNCFGKIIETIIIISGKKINIDYGKFDNMSEKFNEIKLTIFPKKVIVK